MGGGDLPDMYVCMHEHMDHRPKDKCILYSGFCEGENFHEFDKSSSIRENFTCEKFEISTAVQ